jgi:hypothetical protein
MGSATVKKHSYQFDGNGVILIAIASISWKDWSHDQEIDLFSQVKKEIEPS